MMKKIYFDYAATTPVDRDVLEAMLPFFDEAFGNPSSLHSPGQRAKAAIEESRVKISSTIGAKSTEIIFTGSGTESSNFALKGIAFSQRERGDHIITSGIEHHSVLESCRFLESRGFRVTYLPVSSDGMIDPDGVRKAVTGSTILISIMHANNEIGTIQPVAEIGKMAREKEIYFHTDAVQTYGHIPINISELRADLLSISAHKLYGPKGVGALYVRDGISLLPLFHGGGQEGGRRASTHNVPGIVGFGRAAEIAEENMQKEYRHIIGLRDAFISGVLDRIDGAEIIGHPGQRLPGIVSVSFRSIKSEVLLLSLDMKGVFCSTGSACASGTVEPSHVLQSIGLSPESAAGALRFSFGRYTSSEDVDYLLNVLCDSVKQLASMAQ